MSVSDFIALWWIAILFCAPVIGLFYGSVVNSKLSLRTRIIFSLSAIVFLALNFTPVSLPGVIADHMANSFAFILLCLMLAKNKIVGKAMCWTLLLAILISIGTPFGFVVGLAFGEFAQVPTHTVNLKCDRSARMANAGWVCTSGTEVSVFVRPFYVPLEIELGRQFFDDEEFEPNRIAVIDESSSCSTIVTYEGTEVWRVK